MTIAKGSPWGGPGSLEPGSPVATSDAEAADAVLSLRQNPDGLVPPTIGLLGGDLARTCGAPGDRARLYGPDARRLPVDLGEVHIDGVSHYFVAHLLARHRWWLGRTIAVMNAEFIGPWDVAPRSHPNDGRLDVVEATLGLRDRIKARRLLPSGRHLPHPDIKLRRVTSMQIDLDPGMRLWLDGEPAGPARRIEVRVIPDAWVAVV